MKKLLLLFLSIFMTVSAFAQIDTVFFKPETSGSYELVVDTAKYPFLKDKEVQWYVGFDSTLTNRTNYVARKVFDSEIITVDGKRYLHNEKLGNSWDPGTPNVRTLDLYYGFEIKTKAEESIYFTKAEMEPITKDTVALLHLLKAPELAMIDSVTVFNSILESDTVLNAKIGDTLKFNVFTNSPLDIQLTALATEDDLYVLSENKSLELVVTEDIENLYVIVSNELGDYMYPYSITVNAYPEIQVTGISYAINSGNQLITTKVDTLNVTIPVIKGDSVYIKILNNVEETLDSLQFTWNKDGLALPEGIQTNANTLIIPIYVKPDMDGTYNCIIKSENNTWTVSITFNSEFPTSNELLKTSEVIITNSGNGIVCHNICGKEIKVYNSIGQLITTKLTTSSVTDVLLSSGIYVVKIGNQTFKVKVS